MEETGKEQDGGHDREEEETRRAHGPRRRGGTAPQAESRAEVKVRPAQGGDRGAEGKVKGRRGESLPEVLSAERGTCVT